MRIVLVVIAAGLMTCLAGCALTPETAPAESVALVTPLVPDEEQLPAVQAVLFQPPPKAVRVATPPSRQAAKEVKKETAKETTRELARERAVETAKEPADGLIKASAKSSPGPAWLKACWYHQQQADAIMCDADSLLAQPSDKVIVYVRDPKLSRKSSGSSRIALRESLPRLYRFFVLE
ncbi:MAG: hypothetical protein JWL63_2594 [Rhodocyclales bacterium]|nr:hypothetical protein [Rhodocyclales bacterium]